MINQLCGDWEFGLEVPYCIAGTQKDYMCRHLCYEERSDCIAVIVSKEGPFELFEDSLSQQHIQQFNQNLETAPNTSFKVTDLLKPC